MVDRIALYNQHDEHVGDVWIAGDTLAADAAVAGLLNSASALDESLTPQERLQRLAARLWTPYLYAVDSSAVQGSESFEFHLPGKHPQKRHGYRSKGGVLSVKSKSGEWKPVKRAGGKNIAPKPAGAAAIFGENMIVDRSGVVIVLERQRIDTHVADLAKVPDALHQRMADAGVSVHIGVGAMPSLDSNQHTAGMIPRGWESTGKTWDDVPGGYNQVAKSISAGTRGGHGASSLVLHEYGHAFEHEVIRKDPNLLASATDLHRRTFDTLGPYLQQGGPGGHAGVSEMIAESFSEYYSGVRTGRHGASDQRDQWLADTLKSIGVES